MNDQFFSFTLKSILIASLSVKSLIHLFHTNVLFLYPMKHKKFGCFLTFWGEKERNTWLKMG